MKKWKFIGVNFDHMHMGDLLRMVHDHPEAEITGIYDPDPERMAYAARELEIPAERIHTNLDACIAEAGADAAIICSRIADHADYVDKLSKHGLDILVEKPFAASLEDADRMIECMEKTDNFMLINWPLRWVATHVAAKGAIDKGLIGEVREVHYYDGNRGPLWHGADKIELEPTIDDKSSKKSWFYNKEAGGGSQIDYLGYGVTLGTWFNGGQIPVEVSSMTGGASGLEVDEHSITIVRYADWLSKFETRWGTFTDPWVHQPQPKCGFTICGSEGTISSYDYEPTIRVQTRERPDGYELEVDPLPKNEDNPISYMINCMKDRREPGGPLSPAIARIGQQILDTAVESAALKRALPLKQ